MKRDMDMIREILLQLEREGSIDGIEGRTAKEVAYHISLLEDAGLITQDIYINIWLNDSSLDGIRITWSGHEFLDSARLKSVWERAKKLALQKTGALSFEVLKAILVQGAKQALEEIAA